MSKMRVQKFLAEAGVVSRRGAEAMILEGRIEVNGRTVTQLPCFVDPSADRIRVDGQTVTAAPTVKTYILLNKPRGMVCSLSDVQGRVRVYDVVPPMKGQVYCVGSLDVDTTGLVLVTNDGELANRLQAPRYGVPRTYVVEVDGRVGGDAVDKLISGVFIDRRRATARRVEILGRSAEKSVLEVELVESAGREVRPMLARLGYKARRMRRTAIGPVTDKGIKTGRFRLLNRREIESLRQCGALRQPPLEGGAHPRGPVRRRHRPGEGNG